ncbi:MAG: hypothetical protein UI647_08290 [Negativibacillus sp.]
MNASFSRQTSVACKHILILPQKKDKLNIGGEIYRQFVKGGNLCTTVGGFVYQSANDPTGLENEKIATNEKSLFSSTGMCYIIKKAKRKVREEKRDGVFKSVFYVSVFAAESDFVFYIVQQDLAQWGAVGFFPLFLCVGRAGVGVYADAHRFSGLHLGKMHRIFSIERAEPPDEVGAGSFAPV